MVSKHSGLRRHTIKEEWCKPLYSLHILSSSVGLVGPQYSDSPHFMKSLIHVTSLVKTYTMEEYMESSHGDVGFFSLSCSSVIF